MVLALVLFSALVPQQYLPHDPTVMNLGNRFMPVLGPDGLGGHYVLGTDSLGRDMLSRIIFSGRYSLLVALSAAVVATFAAVCLGLSSGYMGGRIDAAVRFLVEAVLPLPVILLAVALAAVVEKSVFGMTAILAFVGWAGYTRVLRAEVLTLREMPFVEAARAAGASTLRVLVRSILPNTVSTMTVMSTYLIARFILIESSISFLGMGITPPASSWGTMVGEGREYIFEAPLASALPGLMIVIAIMAINFVGDGLRDAWDPLRRSKQVN
jgi:peptide/nickel transport system permease protein